MTYTWIQWIQDLVVEGEQMIPKIGPKSLGIELASKYVQKTQGPGLDGTVHRSWNYESGLVLKGIERVSETLEHGRYFEYLRHMVNRVVTPDGHILGYLPEDYNLDQLNEGKLLFGLLRKTGDKRYRTAIDRLVTQIQGQPRTKSGGFWHKKIYPFQIWLDGAYMSSPFLAQYAKEFDQPGWMDDVVGQILRLEERTRDVRTGLLYHAWDETREERWADPKTGCSPHFWGRAMGWFTMAITDVLDFLPLNHPKRASLMEIFQRLINALTGVQDPRSGLWCQVLDYPPANGNYVESSCSAMFIYAIAKGVRKGYLAPRFAHHAKTAYEGLLLHRIERDNNGAIHLTHCNAVAGLGNTPYRDGSYEYYVQEKVTTDDAKALGALMLACVELSRLDEVTE